MSVIKNYSLIIFSFVWLAAGCSSSKITAAWTSPRVSNVPYQKILVMAVINKPDLAIQQNMEKHFVGDLSDRGYPAVTALETYGPKAFDQLSEKEVLPKLDTSGADAVITIVLVNRQRERTYIPANANRDGSLGNYVRGRYQAIYEPGYYVINTKYLWETNLYELPSGKLLYSVQTLTFSPSGIETMGREYGRLIVRDMVKKGVLPKQNPKN